MGLFDRFRKKIKQADEDNGITAEDGSAEAEQALRKRESLEEGRRKTRNKGTLERKETRKLNQKANGTNLKMKSKTRSKNQVVPRRGSSQQEIRP